MDIDEMRGMPIEDVLKMTTFKWGQLGVYYKDITITTDMEGDVSPKKFGLDAQDPDIIAALIDPNTLLNEAYDVWDADDEDEENTWKSGLITHTFGGFGNVDASIGQVFDGFRDGTNEMNGSEGNEAMDEIAEWEFPYVDDPDYDDDEDDSDWETVQENRDHYEATVHFKWSPFYEILCSYQNDDGSGYFELWILHTPDGWFLKKED